MKSFFKSKFQNVERETFKNTKSYSEGMVKQLAKYYSEYSKADNVEKQVITTVIKSDFANFDESKIESTKLRNFLINIRGF
jgi:hypothetical protein